MQSKFLPLFALVACTQTSSAPSNSTSVAGPQSEAETVVRDIARLADARDFDALERRFTSHVVLDYGYPDLVTPRDIKAAWMPLLSAFDATKHELRDVKVFEKNGRLLVGSAFHAVHTLGGDTWTLDGRYEYELVKEDGALRVSRMRMIPTQSSGNTALPEEAKKRAHIVEMIRDHTIEHVAWRSGGDEIVGWLYRPTRAIANEIVIAAGSWTTVKEMMPRLYAKKLADDGFATLIFDFRGWGESEGEPRYLESPSRKIDDFLAAVDWVSTRPDLAGSRITLLGVCASAGYAAHAATRSNKVTRLALIAPWLHDAMIARTMYTSRPGLEPNGYDALIAEGKAAGPTQRVTGASASDPHAAMYVPKPDAPGDYYFSRERGLIPQWGNTFAVQSWPEWLTFDAIAAAPKLHLPTVIVHSENAAIPQGAKAFITKLPAPPEAHWLEGTQLDFYDHADRIAESTALVEHFITPGAVGDDSKP